MTISTEEQYNKVRTKKGKDMMKSQFGKVWLGALLAFFLTGCNNDDLREWEYTLNEAGKQVMIVANMPEDGTDTRLSLSKGEDGNGHEIVTVKWDAKDEKFLLMTENGTSGIVFKQMDAEEESGSARFTGTLPEGNAPYYAFYSGKIVTADTCKVTELPYDLSVQSGALADSLGNLYLCAKSDKYATAEDLSLDFRHLGIIVKLTLSGFTGTPQSVQLKGDAISAKGTFNLVDDTHTVTDNVVTVCNTLVDADTDTEAYDLYIHLLPTSGSGKSIQIALTNSEGKTFEGEITTTKPLQAGFFYTASAELAAMEGSYILTGTTQVVAPTVGDGSEENPYEIHTAENLRWFLELNEKSEHYKLTHSIEIAKDYNHSSKKMTGVFNGGGYMISGILSSPLFNIVESDGEVYNLHMAANRVDVSDSGISVEGGNGGRIAIKNYGKIMDCSNSGSLSWRGSYSAFVYAGGIVQANYGEIVNCSNSGALLGNSHVVIGGIVGYNMGLVKDCQNFGNIENNNYAGGIVGESDKNEDGSEVIISGCLNKGLCYGTQVGGIVGYMNTGTIKDCHNVGSIDRNADALSGGIVGELQNGVILNCINDGPIKGYKAGGIVGDIRGNNSIRVCSNNGMVAADECGGIVGDCGLVQFNREKKTEIIDCNNNAAVYGGGTHVGGIVGVLEQICEITSCTNNGPILGEIEDGGNVGGIVGYIKYYGSSLSNCVNKGDITGGYTVGGVVGYSPNTSSIIYCENRGDIEVPNGKDIGGILGSGGITVKYCKNYGNLTGKKRFRSMGGIIGISATAIGCMNSGSVAYTEEVADGSRADIYIGGIAGKPENVVDSCKNSGFISGGFAEFKIYLGGIVGYGDANHIENEGNVTGLEGLEIYVGGITGKGNVEYGRNSATVIGGKSFDEYGGSYTGGLVGYGKAINCKNSGEVIGGQSLQGTSCVGGVVGHNHGNCEYCENEGTVNGGNTMNGCFTGGIAGSIGGKISYCSNSGDVLGGVGITCSYAGGISGHVFYDVIGCKNAGTITGGKAAEDVYTGGIAGHGRYGIDLINTGAVIAPDMDGAVTGGFFGYGGGIRNSRNEGEIKGDRTYQKSYFGGFAGEAYDAKDFCIMCSKNTAKVAGEAPNESNLVGHFIFGTTYCTDCSKHSEE